MTMSHDPVLSERVLGYIREWYVEPPMRGAWFRVTDEDWCLREESVLPVRMIYGWEPRWLPGQPRLVVVPDEILLDGTVRRGRIEDMPAFVSAERRLPDRWLLGTGIRPGDSAGKKTASSARRLPCAAARAVTRAGPGATSAAGCTRGITRRTPG